MFCTCGITARKKARNFGLEITGTFLAVVLLSICQSNLITLKFQITNDNKGMAHRNTIKYIEPWK